MGTSDELEYLKSLVAQLNEKINALEAKAQVSAPKTPAQQLRTILVGPPGAGTYPCHADCVMRTFFLQEREHRHLELARSFVFVI